MSSDRQFCLITNINVELLTLMSVNTTCSFIIKIDQINTNSLDKQAKRKSVF